MRFLRNLLWPFSLIYTGITAFRNWAFSHGYLSSVSYSEPVINVGNLSTGGTGKTPMIEFLLENLNQKMAVVSRGYGRKTKGLLVVERSGSAEQYGDEPLQIARKFKDTTVVVSEKRQAGVDYLLQSEKPPELILLDDAFQHRYVKAGFSILLSTYKTPFYHDFVLPHGNLRESRSGAGRAQAVVITKCPAKLSKETMAKIRMKVARYTEAPVYFSTLEYGQLRAIAANSHKPTSKIAVLTGIAKPEPMLNKLEADFEVVRHFKFKDHHTFRMSEIREVSDFIKTNNLCLVTTEKDLSRLEENMDLMPAERVYVLPVKTAFLEKQAEAFITQVRACLKESESL